MDYDVYDDAIPQNGFENCFHISVINVSQKRLVGVTHRRSYDFDIAFFPESDSISEFYAWSEKVLQAFDILSVDDENSYKTKDISMARVDGIWHFTFAVSFFVREVVNETAMENLEMEGRIANGNEGN